MWRSLVVVLVCTGGVALASPSRGIEVAAADAPALRYGALTQEECEAELTAREIEFTRETAAGVLAPVRLTAPLHGVTFRTNLREDRRATTPWEIADCRLVLALDDFAEILARHGVVEVRHYSMYRAPHRDDGTILGQHNGGLALDAARFIKSDGTTLDVLDDFKGRRGSKTCGTHARKVKAAAAIELREIVCEAVDRQLFNVVLTPNFNRAHRNHFHLEVTAGVKWFMVR